MDELRWILLGLGVVIIIGVYGYSRWQHWRQQGAPWRARQGDKREPFADEIEPDLDDGDPLGAPAHDVGPSVADAEGIIGSSRVISGEARVEPPMKPAEPLAEPEPTEPTEPTGPTEPAAPAKPTGAAVPDAGSGEEKIVALTVMAKDRGPYRVADLIEVLEGAGLRQTEQGIFRRGMDTGHGTAALYTVANILEPGTFDRQTGDETTTPGVALIMQLPGPFDGLVTFEQMLATAQRIAERLGGHVLDARRCDLTAQSIEHIREELLEYRRRARLASRQGG